MEKEEENGRGKEMIQDRKLELHFRKEEGEARISDTCLRAWCRNEREEGKLML